MTRHTRRSFQQSARDGLAHPLERPFEPILIPSMTWAQEKSEKALLYSVSELLIFHISFRTKVEEQ